MTLHEYLVRRADAGCAVQLRGVVDRPAGTVIVELPGGDRVALDVVTARALHMLLAEVIYGALEPSGPYLRLERIGGAGVGGGGAELSGGGAAG
ncbi:MAG: hypothetical protein ACRDT6_25545 [Micromonosporaceae bacterium]